MHEWLTEFEEAYPLSSIPPYTRVLSPIHSWKNIVVIADSTSIFYYGSAKSKSAGKRIRLFEGLEKSVGPFPGANIPIKWNCEEGNRYDGQERCHNDLAVAGADYTTWLDYVKRYIERTPPRNTDDGYYPDDHLVLWFDVGNSWAKRQKDQKVEEYMNSC